MKRWLFKVFIVLLTYFLNESDVFANMCYFNIIEEKDYYINNVLVELGINKNIEVKDALLFLEYDNNILELNNKKDVEIITFNNKSTIAIKTKDKIKLDFKIKNNNYVDKTSLIFSPQTEHGYFNSKSIIYTTNGNISCNTQIINVKLNDEKIQKNKSNLFIKIFLFFSFLLIFILIVIVINNIKVSKSDQK